MFATRNTLSPVRASPVRASPVRVRPSPERQSPGRVSPARVRTSPGELQPKYQGEINRDLLLSDLEGPMTVCAVAAKHHISVSTVHRIRRAAGVAPHRVGHPRYKLV